MKERGIIFSAPMIRALLAGRKTQTRRLVKLPRGGEVDGFAPDEHQLCWSKSHQSTGENRQPCPYGVPGERLWIRETWCLAHPDYHNDRDRLPDRPTKDGRWCFYRATDPDVENADKEGASPWRSPIHMPRWASRIALEVTEVRVQRLHEITEDDAKAEGVEPVRYDPEGDCWTATEAARRTPHRVAFEFAWNEIHGWAPWPAWEANPWVWAISFRRLP